MDGKAAGFKLEGGTAAHLPPPVAGESLNRPDESKLSSVRFLLSPFGLASPALRPAALSAATGRGWMRESALAECDRW